MNFGPNDNPHRRIIFTYLILPVDALERLDGSMPPGQSLDLMITNLLCSLYKVARAVLFEDIPYSRRHSHPPRVSLAGSWSFMWSWLTKGHRH
jgi:hypothetical protein